MEDFSNLSSLVDRERPKTFLDSPINKQAKQDFSFLCSQTNLAALANLNFIAPKSAVEGVGSLGDFLPLGMEINDKRVEFPANLIDTASAEQYVAVVCYKDERPIDVLVFRAIEFAKTGLFSIFKNKNGLCSIKIGDINSPKMKERSFGYVKNKIESKKAAANHSGEPK
ncbi:MAG: hypothetical protein LBM01_00465 [Christensenellaceae bacterium]|jgi:hypothetical protein|nr:hypothetical protein [Christensenellaceae bacterium]